MVARLRFVADIRNFHNLVDDSVFPLLPLLRAAFVDVRTATVTGSRDLVLTYLPQYVACTDTRPAAVMKPHEPHLPMPCVCAVPGPCTVTASQTGASAVWSGPTARFTGG